MFWVTVATKWIAIGAVDHGGQADQQQEGEKSDFHFRETVGDFKLVISRENKENRGNRGFSDDLDLLIEERKLVSMP